MLNMLTTQQYTRPSEFSLINGRVFPNDLHLSPCLKFTLWEITPASCTTYRFSLVKLEHTPGVI